MDIHSVPAGDMILIAGPCLGLSVIIIGVTLMRWFQLINDARNEWKRLSKAERERINQEAWDSVFNPDDK